MGKLDTLAADLARRFQVPEATACAALCLVLKAHHGDAAAGRSVAAMATRSPRAAALLAEALRTLQRDPAFWVSHYAMKSAGAFTTGDLWGDISNAASSTVQSVAQVVKDPGKALAKAASDITRDPLSTLGNVIQSAINVAVPLDLLKPIPGLGTMAQIAKSFSPLSNLGKLANAALHGNMAGVIDVAKTELSHLQMVASYVPGIGTGVSTAIGAAEALISGGSPLEIALRAAYGAIPIPPGIRDVTDTVLDTVIALLKGGNVTDVALSVARDRIPEGLPRDVFDTLAQIVVRHAPIVQAAGELAAHEAMKAAQGLGPALVAGIAKNIPSGVASLLSKLPDPIKSFPSLPANVMGVAGLIGKLPANMQKAAAAQIAPIAAKMVPTPRVPATPPKKLVFKLTPPPAAPKPPPKTLALRLGPAPSAASSAALLTANAPYDMYAPQNA